MEDGFDRLEDVERRLSDGERDDDVSFGVIRSEFNRDEEFGR